MGKIKIPFGGKKDYVNNKGIDIKSKIGSLVFAAKSGLVSYIDTNMRGLGKVIMIDHQDGFLTGYAHLGNIFINQGDVVKQGQKIGTVGQTGKVNEPVLHFEIRKDGKAVDPEAYI